MTNNQLAENSIIQLLNSVKLARDNAERADNLVDHSFYYALTIALEELQERRKAAMDGEPDCKERKLFCSTDTARMRKAISVSAGTEGAPLYRHAQPAPVVPAVSDDMGEIRVGRLPTMNQDDYPGLGDWWVQLRIGEDSDEVLARVYGATPQEANNRAEALACRAAMLNGVKP